MTFSKITLFVLYIFISISSYSQTYLSWDEVQTKKFGKELFFSLLEDKKPLNGDYKIAENSGSYADISFTNGKIDGNYINYNFEGKKISEAAYINGKIEGKQISYFQNGKIQEENQYKNGLKEGTWFFYNKKGEKISTENYINDNKEGKWVKTLKNPAENTTSTVTEYYKNNEPTGHWEERLTDGKLKWEKTYSTPTDYTKKTYHPNTKLATEITIKDRKKSGLATYYSPEGILLHKIKYDEDHIVYKEIYFENGTLKSKSSNKYGTTNGVYERYNEDGIKIEEGNRKDTYKEGVWKIYEGKKGRLVSEITYKNDNKNGTAKFYDTTSKKVSQEGEYLNGKQHGIWKHYDPSGELTKEVEYNKGKQVSEKTYD